VCASCSRGCNATVTALDGEIKRLVARENPAVNKYWMCDEGRLNFGYVGSERRLRAGRGTASELGGAAAAIAQEHGPGSMAGLVSTYQTVEEIWLFKKLMTALSAETVGVLSQSRGERQRFPGGFTIEAEKTPNRTFAESVFGEETVAVGANRVIADIFAGKIKGLVVVNGIPDFTYPADFVRACEDLEFLAVIDLMDSPLAKRAHVLLPAAAWAEKDGTFLNVDRRVQRIRRAIAPPSAAQPELDLLQSALVELKVRERVMSAESVFKEVAAELAPFAGLDYGKVGLKGVALSNGSPK
jgi:NADH-quinone oxidoreductase subunit G